MHHSPVLPLPYTESGMVVLVEAEEALDHIRRTLIETSANQAVLQACSPPPAGSGRLPYDTEDEQPWWASVCNGSTGEAKARRLLCVQYQSWLYSKILS